MKKPTLKKNSAQIKNVSNLHKAFHLVLSLTFSFEPCVLASDLTLIRNSEPTPVKDPFSIQTSSDSSVKQPSPFLNDNPLSQSTASNIRSASIAPVNLIQMPSATRTEEEVEGNRKTVKEYVNGKLESETIYINEILYVRKKKDFEFYYSKEELKGIYVPESHDGRGEVINFVYGSNGDLESAQIHYYDGGNISLDYGTNIGIETKANGERRNFNFIENFQSSISGDAIISWLDDMAEGIYQEIKEVAPNQIQPPVPVPVIDPMPIEATSSPAFISMPLPASIPSVTNTETSSGSASTSVTLLTATGTSTSTPAVNPSETAPQPASSGSVSTIPPVAASSPVAVTSVPIPAMITSSTDLSTTLDSSSSASTTRSSPSLPAEETANDPSLISAVIGELADSVPLTRTEESVEGSRRTVKRYENGELKSETIYIHGTVYVKKMKGFEFYYSGSTLKGIYVPENYDGRGKVINFTYGISGTLVSAQADYFDGSKIILNYETKSGIETPANGEQTHFNFTEVLESSMPAEVKLSWLDDGTAEMYHGIKIGIADKVSQVPSKSVGLVTESVLTPVSPFPVPALPPFSEENLLQRKSQISAATPSEPGVVGVSPGTISGQAPATQTPTPSTAISVSSRLQQLEALDAQYFQQLRQLWTKVAAVKIELTETELLKRIQDQLINDEGKTYYLALRNYGRALQKAAEDLAAGERVSESDEALKKFMTEEELPWVEPWQGLGLQSLNTLGPREYVSTIAGLHNAEKVLEERWKEIEPKISELEVYLQDLETLFSQIHFDVDLGAVTSLEVEERTSEAVFYRIFFDGGGAIRRMPNSWIHPSEVQDSEGRTRELLDIQKSSSEPHHYFIATAEEKYIPYDLPRAQPELSHFEKIETLQMNETENETVSFKVEYEDGTKAATNVPKAWIYLRGFQDAKGQERSILNIQKSDSEPRHYFISIENHTYVPFVSLNDTKELEVRLNHESLATLTAFIDQPIREKNFYNTLVEKYLFQNPSDEVATEFLRFVIPTYLKARAKDPNRKSLYPSAYGLFAIYHETLKPENKAWVEKSIAEIWNELPVYEKASILVDMKLRYHPDLEKMTLQFVRELDQALAQDRNHPLQREIPIMINSVKKMIGEFNIDPASRSELSDWLMTKIKSSNESAWPSFYSIVNPLVESGKAIFDLDEHSSALLDSLKKMYEDPYRVYQALSYTAKKLSPYIDQGIEAVMNLFVKSALANPWRDHPAWVHQIVDALSWKISQASREQILDFIARSDFSGWNMEQLRLFFHYASGTDEIKKPPSFDMPRETALGFISQILKPLESHVDQVLKTGKRHEDGRIAIDYTVFNPFIQLVKQNLHFKELSSLLIPLLQQLNPRVTEESEEAYGKRWAKIQAIWQEQGLLLIDTGGDLARPGYLETVLNFALNHQGWTDVLTIEPVIIDIIRDDQGNYKEKNLWGFVRDGAVSMTIKDGDLPSQFAAVLIHEAVHSFEKQPSFDGFISYWLRYGFDRANPNLNEMVSLETMTSPGEFVAETIRYFEENGKKWLKTAITKYQSGYHMMLNHMLAIWNLLRPEDNHDNQMPLSYLNDSGILEWEKTPAQWKSGDLSSGTFEFTLDSKTYTAEFENYQVKKLDPI